jgi:hypothetical protein
MQREKRLRELSCLDPISRGALKNWDLYLSIKGETGPAILLPAGFGFVVAERLLFAVADDADAAGIDARGDEDFLCRIGPVFPERKVVFVRAAFIAVSADDDLHTGMALEERGVFGENILVARANAVLVVVKVDVLHVRAEQFFIAGGGR